MYLTTTSDKAPWYAKGWYLNAIEAPKPLCMKRHKTYGHYIPGIDAYTEQLCRNCYCRQFGRILNMRPINATTLWYSSYDNYSIYNIKYNNIICSAWFSIYRKINIDDPNATVDCFMIKSIVRLCIYNIPSRIHDMASEISFLIEIFWDSKRIYSVRFYAADTASLRHIAANNVNIVLSAAYDSNQYDYIEYIAMDGTTRRITIDDVIFAIGPKSELLYEI